ncbi:winged helix DNA-binding domain-containing protein [Spirillospora sp. NPDC029432]|uniref:winged helix DNA-binding domain-containing protein n=1 Tax=Spirillospora sp. NPDC029432 TaxID=3154599 RepID=UPI0034531243
MRRAISSTERRARLGVRHRLAPGAAAADPPEVARSLVAVHSTDPSSVYLGTLARMAGGDLGTVERALYDDRTLIRLLAMRRTVFVTALDVAPVVQAACSRAVAERERRKLIGMLAEAGVGGADPEGWLEDAEAAGEKALAARGEATAAELASDDPLLGTQIVLSKGKKYEGRQNVASRVLLLLAAQGRAVRGRPRGSWTSHQYRWSPLELWCPDGLADWETGAAEVELARRWLRAYGPATADDLRWWTGWTKTRTAKALAALDTAEVVLDGGADGLVLADDLEPVPEPEPWAALLPALDSTPMGWQAREWFLGEHGPKLFDRMGNVGPTVWWNGRIVGGWAQDRDGAIVCRFLEDAGSEAAAAVEAAAERRAELLGGVRLNPRTRGMTWLEEELKG